MDDSNFEAYFAESALRRAEQLGQRGCAELAYILTGMTPTQRLRLANLPLL